jgi:hypothetical protein
VLGRALEPEQALERVPVWGQERVWVLEPELVLERAPV